MQPCKSSIRVILRIDRDVNLCGSKLLNHGIEVSNAKVDHPLLVGTAEIICVVRKWGKDRRPGFLRPGFLTVVTGYKIDS